MKDWSTLTKDEQDIVTKFFALNRVLASVPFSCKMELLKQYFGLDDQDTSAAGALLKIMVENPGAFSIIEKLLSNNKKLLDQLKKKDENLEKLRKKIEKLRKSSVRPKVYINNAKKN